MWWLFAVIAVMFFAAVRTERGIDVIAWLDHTGLPLLFAAIILAVPIGGTVAAVMLWGIH